MASTSGQREITPLEELAALEDAQEKLDEGWACAQGDDLDTAIELLGEALSLRYKFCETQLRCMLTWSQLRTAERERMLTKIDRRIRVSRPEICQSCPICMLFVVIGTSDHRSGSSLPLLALVT
jgi:hypothetical protein